MNRKIYITSTDMQRLKEMIEKAKYSTTKEQLFYLDALESELKNANVVESKEIPNHIITMNSVVRFVDLNESEEMVYSLVYPDDADILKNKLSILAPIGTAIIGYSVGDTIEWEVPGGKLRLLIKEILYQPESHGHFQL